MSGVTHSKTSAIADALEATIVGPDEWNAAHSGFYGIDTYEADLGSILFSDFGSRVSASGWGTTAKGGRTWSVTIGGGASSSSVTGGEGLLALNGTPGGTQAATIANDVTIDDGELYFEFNMSTLAGDIVADGLLRYVREAGASVDTGIFFQILWNATTNLFEVAIKLWGTDPTKTTGDQNSPGILAVPHDTYVPAASSTYYGFRMRVVGTKISVKLWKVSTGEPTEWTNVWDYASLFSLTGIVVPTSGSLLVHAYGRAVSTSRFRNFSVRTILPRTAGSFDITGLSGLTAGDDVCVFQLAAATSDNLREDEAEMDSIRATGYVVDATTIRVYWESDYPVSGSYKFGYFSKVATGMTHAFPSPIVDDGSALVGPDDWDAAHVGGPTFGQFEGDLGVNYVVKDFDSRVVASGWGTAQIGGAWGTSLPGAASVSGGVGTLNASTAYIAAASDDCEAVFEVTVPVDGTGHVLYISLHGVYDGSSFVGGLNAQLTFNSVGLMVDASIDQYAADGVTIIRTLGHIFPASGGLTVVAATYYTVRYQVAGRGARVKMWKSSDDEPINWILSGDLSQAPLTGLDPSGSLFGLTMDGTVKNIAVRRVLARTEGSFDVTGLTGLTAGKPVYVFQRAAPLVDAGSRQDEAEMGIVQATGYVVDASTIRVYWKSATPARGRVKFAYVVGG